MKILFIVFIIFIGVCSSCESNNKVTKNRDQIVAPYDGKKFNNLEPFPDKSFFSVLKWKLSSLFNKSSWKENLDNKVYKPKFQRSDELKIVVINHSTVLIQMNNLNILTDPIYAQRASPVSFAGPKRVIKPGIAFDDLPPIDIIVISHDHYDHLELETLNKLNDKFSPQIYVGLGNKSLLNEYEIKNVIEMDWWDQKLVKDIQINFVPVQHWSARGASDKRETLWGGFVINGKKKVFFAGDTGYGKVFKLIYQKLGAIDISLIPIGAYQPRNFMKNAHVWPKESVKIFQDTKTKQAVGIHFGTFADLTDEAIDQPKKDLYQALSEQNISKDKFIIPEFGQTYF